MNKIELLRVIGNSTMKYDTEKGCYCRACLDAWEKAMRSIPEDKELGDIPNAAFFRTPTDFDNFVKDASVDEMKSVFNQVLQYVREKALPYVEPETLKAYHGVAKAIDDKLALWRWVVIGAITVGIIVVRILDAAKCLPDNEWVDAIMSIWDVGISVGFLIYEQVEDKRKGKVGEAASAVTESVKEVKKTIAENMVAGFGNKVNYGDQYQRDAVQRLDSTQETFYKKSKKYTCGNCVCGCKNEVDYGDRFVDDYRTTGFMI